MDYQKFLEGKTVKARSMGIEPEEPHKMLFDFQRDIVKWAVRLGRACVWADCGLGKTLMQLSWAAQIPGDVLILAPLAVAQQTVEEAAKIGLKVRYSRRGDDVKKGITITNYQMLSHFDCARFTGVVLDESGILKSLDGKTRNLLIQTFNKTKYRSCWTATPAPNDHMELGNHVEFLGLMTYSEMLSMFFVHDGGETQKWRLKGHAKEDFWKWVSSWAIMLRKPSDLGYEDRNFILPPLIVKQEVVEHVSAQNHSGLLPWEAQTLPERIIARRESVSARVTRTAEIVKQKKGTWLIWCHLNKEADLAVKMIPGAIQVSGSDSIESKIEKITGFSYGKYPILVSKVSITGHGMNWQHCHQEAFIGLTDSWEQYYQAVRRCWRFGQKEAVTVHIVTAKAEGAVLKNILRKETAANKMLESMLKNMKDLNKANLKGQSRTTSAYALGEEKSKRWKMYLGDCVETMAQVKSDSVGYSIFSPPFSSLYTYSASTRDMGNSSDDNQFFQHFRFMIKEMYRVIQPGRCVSFHCMNLPTSKTMHGVIGVRDFRGELIYAFCKEGFIYHSEVCIWKDPVTAMQRTKAIGLLWKQLKKDSCMSRMGIADYLVTMRKPGVNARPVGHRPEDFPVSRWQQWASPVWMDINPSDTLQYRSAREHDDERHICPLQLEVIRRGIVMWSRPGDIVLSPFAGIGSEGHVTIEQGRKYIGIELKKSYYEQAVKNLYRAEKIAITRLFK